MGAGPWACLLSNVPTHEAPSIGEHSAIHQMDHSKTFRYTEEQIHRSLSNVAQRGLSLKLIFPGAAGSGAETNCAHGLESKYSSSRDKETHVPRTQPSRGPCVSAPAPALRASAAHGRPRATTPSLPINTGYSFQALPERGEQGGPKQRLKW